MAYEVVMLHCSQAPVNIVRPIVDSAVPCFFMISGFFIYQEGKIQYENKLRRAIKKIAIILLWSTLLCGLNDIYQLAVNHYIGNFTLKALCNFVFFNENPFAFHLWYISAYLYTLVIYQLLGRLEISVNVIWLLTLWIAGICLVLGYIFFFHQDINIIYVRNFLFQGIPFFGIGIVLKRNKSYFDKWNFTLILCILSIVILLAIVEKTNEPYWVGTFFFSGIIAFLVFLLFTKIQITKKNWLSVIGKEDGLYIYIFHPLFMNMLKFAHLSGFYSYNPYFHSTIVFVITVSIIRFFRLGIMKNSSGEYNNMQ